MANDVLTDEFSVPLGGATTAEINIDAGCGNLTIDRLTDGERLLASGSLQYIKKRGAPKRSVTISGDEVSLTLVGDGGRPRFRLPWMGCDVATEWRVHLNPRVSCDLAAHSDGGNIKLDLAEMAITRLSADTGGGNIDVVLPDNAANLEIALTTGGGNVAVDVGSGTTGSNTVDAKSGAGNVTVRVPVGIAARIHATTGLGKASVDPRFNRIDKNTYQSPDYDGAANKIDIKASSGAGNVIINTK